MSVTVIVPWSTDDLHRIRVWEWCRARWAMSCARHEWTLVEAPDPVPRLPWSKGRAVRAALTGSEDVIVVADADIVLIDAQVEHMVDNAIEHGWATPAETVYRLHEAKTAEVLASVPWSVTHGPVDRLALARPAYRLVPGGGCVAVSGAAWREVGGIDPRFEGWGGEDRALACALKTLVGHPVIGAGAMWHLWHPPSPHIEPGDHIPGRAKRLLGRYRQAMRDPSRMRALVGEHQEVADAMRELRG